MQLLLFGIVPPVAQPRTIWVICENVFSAAVTWALKQPVQPPVRNVSSATPTAEAGSAWSPAEGGEGAGRCEDPLSDVPADTCVTRNGLWLMVSATNVDSSGGRAGYARRARRSTAASPSRPMPTRSSVPGSGT